MSRKKILITGGNGYIAKSIKNSLWDKYHIIAPGREELDLLSSESVDAFFEGKHFDVIIHTATVGGSRLKEEDEININYQQISKDKFFYDVIYNPPETNFLKNAKKYGGITKNGKMMFIYQAQKAFFIWHKIVPEVDNETINLLDV